MRIKTNAAAVATTLRRVAGGVRSETQRAVASASLAGHASLKRSMTGKKRRHPFWGVLGGEGGTLVVRTGLSRNRISPGGRVTEVRIASGATRYLSAVGSPDEHIRFLERGGVISGSDWLRLPTAKAQTPSGVDRNRGRSMRDVPGFFIWPTRRMLSGPNGARWANVGPWIVRAVAGALEKWYLLKRSVRLRGRGLFREATRVAGGVLKKAGVAIGVVVRNGGRR